MDGVFQKIDARTVVVASERAAEALSHIRDGAQFVGNIKAARNPRQHRLFWKLVGLVAESQDATQEGVKRWLLRKLNYVEMIELVDGSIDISPMSIAYASMAQAEFAQLFRAAMPVIAELMEIAEKALYDQYVSILEESDRRYLERILKHVEAPSLAPDHPSRERELQE